MNACISENLFNRFVEDALTDEELGFLEKHVAACPACNAELENWKLLKITLSEDLAFEVPDSLKSSIMEKVQKEKIINAPEPVSFKRKMTAAMLLLLTAGYYFFPFLRPYTSAFTQEAASYLLELGYNIMRFMGLDIKSVFAFIKVFISLFNELSIVFVSGTLMLIVGFFSLILGGRAKLKAN